MRIQISIPSVTPGNAAAYTAPNHPETARVKLTLTAHNHHQALALAQLFSAKVYLEKPPEGTLKAPEALFDQAPNFIYRADFVCHYERDTLAACTCLRQAAEKLGFKISPPPTGQFR
jgi:hypothetical protein